MTIEWVLVVGIPCGTCGGGANAPVAYGAIGAQATVAACPLLKSALFIGVVFSPTEILVTSFWMFYVHLAASWTYRRI